MTHSRQFQAEIYHELERKLKASSWNSGASEAHGLLCGLACRGIRGGQLHTKAWLLQMSARDEIDLLEGMYELILRDFQADGFGFALLLPGEDCSRAQRIEALADWCGGFVQGFLHDGDTLLARSSEQVRESFDDIMKINQIDVDAPARAETDGQLIEIEEYLRVAAQVIFEELNPPSNSVTAANPNANKLH